MNYFTQDSQDAQSADAASAAEVEAAGTSRSERAVTFQNDKVSGGGSPSPPRSPPKGTARRYEQLPLLNLQGVYTVSSDLSPETCQPKPHPNSTPDLTQLHPNST